MRRLYLIRHGRPAATWAEGGADPGLDDVGLAQASVARDWLITLPADERPRRVVSSPLRRCLETAAPTARALGVNVEIDPMVGEIPTPQALQPTARATWLRRAFQGAWAEIEGDLDYDEWRRNIVGSLRARGDTAVFSHYVAINAVISHLLGEDRVHVFQPDHASITVLGTDGRDLTLVAKGREAVTGVL